MKSLTFAFALMVNVSLAQSLQVESHWKKDDPVAYIGLRNELHLKGDISQIRAISSQTASITRTGDILYVSPKTPGETVIRISTNGQEQTYSFRSGYLPDFDVRLFADSLLIRKDPAVEEVRQITKIGIVVPEHTKDDLFEQYEIVNATISLGNQTFILAGNIFSREIKDALLSLRTNDVIGIDNVTIKNQWTGKTLSIRTIRAFKIL